MKYLNIGLFFYCIKAKSIGGHFRLVNRLEGLPLKKVYPVAHGAKVKDADLTNWGGS